MIILKRKKKMKKGGKEKEIEGQLQFVQEENEEKERGIYVFQLLKDNSAFWWTLHSLLLTQAS